LFSRESTERRPKSEKNKKVHWLHNPHCRAKAFLRGEEEKTDNSKTSRHDYHERKTSLYITSSHPHLT